MSCGPFPTVFDFSFVIPTNQISSHPPPPSFPKTISQIFTVFCFLEASLDYEECPSFSSQENLIDFLPPSFPLCRPVAKTSDVFHPPNLCFTKGKPMFCECPGQCFAPQHLTMQLLLPFCPAAHQIKPVVGPSSSCPLPAESVIWGIAPDLDNQPPSVTVF